MSQKSNLLRLAEVMDTLRSPGGCPWDAEQTHKSLLTYLLEESYEFIDAVEDQTDAIQTTRQGELIDLQSAAARRNPSRS